MVLHPIEKGPAWEQRVEFGVGGQHSRDSVAALVHLGSPSRAPPRSIDSYSLLQRPRSPAAAHHKALPVFRVLWRLGGLGSQITGANQLTVDLTRFKACRVSGQGTCERLCTFRGWGRPIAAGVRQPACARMPGHFADALCVLLGEEAP